jgi:hypothetical protein
MSVHYQQQLNIHRFCLKSANILMMHQYSPNIKTNIFTVILTSPQNTINLYNMRNEEKYGTSAYLTMQPTSRYYSSNEIDQLIRILFSR